MKKNLTLPRINTPSRGKKLSSVKCLAMKDGVNKKLKKIAASPEKKMNRTKIFRFTLLNLEFSQLYVRNNFPHSVFINFLMFLIPAIGYQK